MSDVDDTPRARQLGQWLSSYPHRLDVDSRTPGSGESDDSREAQMRSRFLAMIYDLLLLIDEYGYEAVYFGVGCEVFPDQPVPFDKHGPF